MPKANPTPSGPITFPAITADPTPPKTRTKVPTASATPRRYGMSCPPLWTRSPAQATVRRRQRQVNHSPSPGVEDSDHPRTGGGMTGKADFTEEEWARLKRAPFIAGMAISLSDPGGPIELVKETAAAVKVVGGAAQAGDRGELVTALA